MRKMEALRKLAASGRRVTPDTGRDILNDVAFPEKPPRSDVGLMPHQEEHVDKLVNVLQRRSSVADTSGTGTGKTYAAAEVASRLCLPVMVFCPRSAIPTWEGVLKMWGVPIVTITNYDMARHSHGEKEGYAKWYDFRFGMQDKSTICPWIKRKEIKVKGNVEMKYTWDIPYNVYIIFDEGHVAKNSHTRTSNFVSGACRCLRRSGGHKMGVITATPIEKREKNLKFLFYALGLTSKPDMSAVHAYLKQTLGYIPNMEIIHKFLYGENGCASSMPDAEMPSHVQNIITAEAYDIDEDKLKEIHTRNERIKENMKRLEGREYDGTLGEINRLQGEIERMKKDIILRLISWGLNVGVFKRVAVFTNGKETLHEIKDSIRDKYSIAEYHGDLPSGEPERNATLYNEGKADVLLATVDKGGVSVSFHDTVGDKPTLVLIMPPNSATKLGQTLGRHYRAGTQTSVHQKIIFVKGDYYEECIRKALARKAEDMRKLTNGSEGSNRSDLDIFKIFRELD